MYVVPLVTHVIAMVGKIVIAEGPLLGKFVIVDTLLSFVWARAAWKTQPPSQPLNLPCTTPAGVQP